VVKSANAHSVEMPPSVSTAAAIVAVRSIPCRHASRNYRAG
jgi:hypothetical protein